MATVFDVASYILQRKGPLTTMKLQKLVYYAQAWSLVWDGHPLFSEPIEAWDRGPVVRELFERHRGALWIDTLPIGGSSELDPLARETVDAVLERYGDTSPEILSELTHSEAPWQETHKKGNSHQIPLALMRSYYDNLLRDLELAAATHEDEGQEEDVPHGSLFSLKSLLRNVTEANRHEEVDTGAPVGREVW